HNASSTVQQLKRRRRLILSDRAASNVERSNVSVLVARACVRIAIVACAVAVYRASIAGTTAAGPATAVDGRLVTIHRRVTAARRDTHVTRAYTAVAVSGSQARQRICALVAG